jgi:hypothetical protein
LSFLLVVVGVLCAQAFFLVVSLGLFFIWVGFWVLFGCGSGCGMCSIGFSTEN